MPVINKGTALSNGEQLTADKLNDLLDLATFSPTATDSVSTFVNSSGQIAVLDGGIAANKLATNAVTTTRILDANVTFAKLADVIDDDTMATATATSLATSESIKAYVDGASVVQSALVENGANQTITAGIPADNSTPTISEGVQVLSLTMTPTSISNRMKASFIGNIINSTAGGKCVVALFEGNTCVGASTWQQATAGAVPLSMQFYFNPSSTSEKTYTMRVGPDGGTIFFNSYGTLGGLNKSKLYIEELSV